MGVCRTACSCKRKTFAIFTGHISLKQASTGKRSRGRPVGGGGREREDRFHKLPPCTLAPRLASLTTTSLVANARTVSQEQASCATNVHRSVGARPSKRVDYSSTCLPVTGDWWLTILVCNTLRGHDNGEHAMMWGEQRVHERCHSPSPCPRCSYLLIS